MGERDCKQDNQCLFKQERSRKNNGGGGVVVVNFCLNKLKYLRVFLARKWQLRIEKFPLPSEKLVREERERIMREKIIIGKYNSIQVNFKIVKRDKPN